MTEPLPAPIAVEPWTALCFLAAAIATAAVLSVAAGLPLLRLLTNLRGLDTLGRLLPIHRPALGRALSLAPRAGRWIRRTAPAAIATTGRAIAAVICLPPETLGTRIQHDLLAVQAAYSLACASIGTLAPRPNVRWLPRGRKYGPAAWASAIIAPLLLLVTIDATSQSGLTGLTGLNLWRRMRGRTRRDDDTDPTQRRTFIDSAPVAIAMFDTDMRALAASRRFVIDYQPNDETPPIPAERGPDHPRLGLPERWRPLYRRVLAGESLSADNDHFVRANGRVAWHRWEMVPWRQADGSIGGGILFVEDVTHRNVPQEAEARFQQIFNLQFQNILVLAPDGTILEANRSVMDRCDQPRHAIIGRKLWQIIRCGETDDAALPLDIAQVVHGATIRREIEVSSQSGHNRILDLSLKPMRDPATGTVTSILAESRDVTETHELTSQLAQAHKVRALGQLAGGIAHDFNNILQAVSGAAHLIARTPRDHERCLRLATMAIGAAERGTAITQRLLSFARRGELRVEAIDTTELLENIREVLAHTLGSEITVTAEIPGDIPCLIADRSQLETALINLGTNARDAMPSGGRLVLSASTEHFAPADRRPAGLSPGTYVRISVTDSGIGMNEATLARVTEPFFTTKPIGEGTGLGVPMAKGFAEQSGGALAIASTPGQGTTVVIWLPRTDQAIRLQRVLPPAIANLAAEAPVRVLLVEDDDMVRNTLVAELEAEGLMILAAANGLDALAMIEDNKPVDALVSDLSMPGMNGVATIRKARELRPLLPCFLLTGYAGERSALSAGDDFTLVRKPVTGHTLAVRIEAIVRGTA